MIYDNPEFFLNREFSWLEFNNRVLEEALLRNNPLLERVKFLAITGSNLDEFFMIRAAGLMEQVEAEYKGTDPAGYTPEEQLRIISEKVHEMIRKQYDCLNRSLLPQMKKEGIYILDVEDLEQNQIKFLEEYFNSTIYPVITPMALDQSRPFPLLPNKSLNQAVMLEDEQKDIKFALVQVPFVLSRFVQIPSIDEKAKITFVELGQVIKLFGDKLFDGYKILAMHPFRITRNADLSIDEEDSEDLLKEIEKSLLQRRWGFPVRLEIEKNASREIKELLKTMLELDEEDIYEENGPIDLSAFFYIAGLKNFNHLKFKAYTPQISPVFYQKESIFDIIREKDVLIHHPYESFEHVIEFLKEAAEDPKVLAIKQTLYRVSGNSPIVENLIKAARNGKQVTVLVELKARFDEENNIQWAKKLEQAGCYVVYGLVGLKTHCKTLLVVRREEDGIKRYVHLSTGNYNENTAKIYTDLSYFTSKETYGSDASALFNVLTGYSVHPSWKKLIVAPIGLKNSIIYWINNEALLAKKGLESRIIIKVNSLLDNDMVQALYDASKTGVKIDLIVRGICAIKSRVQGLSDNIRVISIVGKYLEHSRIFYFRNNDNPKIFLGSADLMPRNLERRVEVLFPIEEKEHVKKIEEILEMSLNDTEQAREQNSDGSYSRIDKRGRVRTSSQLEFEKQAIKNYKNILTDENNKIFKPIINQE